MATWKIKKEMRFFATNITKEQTYIILKENEIYKEVPTALWDKAITKTVERCKKESHHTSRFIVLDAKGKHRVAQIDKDVVPYSKGIQRRMRIK